VRVRVCLSVCLSAPSSLKKRTQRTRRAAPCRLLPGRVLQSTELHRAEIQELRRQLANTTRAASRTPDSSENKALREQLEREHWQYLDAQKKLQARATASAASGSGLAGLTPLSLAHLCCGLSAPGPGRRTC
jgi:hypothetical protein